MDDLTRVHQVGEKRARDLAELGITTFQQLVDHPPQELDRLPGMNVALVATIKQSAAALIAEAGVGSPLEEDKLEQRLHLQIDKVEKTLQRANEELKPLWKKKYLSYYVNYKKSGKKLLSRLKYARNHPEKLDRDGREYLLGELKLLRRCVKETMAKPKKKNYERCLHQLKQTSKLLKDL